MSRGIEVTAGRLLLVSRVLLLPALIWATTIRPAYAADLDVTGDASLTPGAYSYENVWVRDGATLTLEGDTAAGTGVTITATSITVEDGGVISADDQGYEADEGPGATTNSSCGAGHGGRGGQGYSGTPGEPYGSATMPTTLGSGGSSGAGGGAIRLDVAGTLTVDGDITASALSFTAGSGGSVYITTAAFAGTGAIQANGGSTPCPSCTALHTGGAGGRVAVYYTSNSFTGTIEAKPGAGNQGGATTEFQTGTVGLFDVSNPAQVHLYTGDSWRFQASDVDKDAITYYSITAEDSELIAENGVEIVVTDAFTISRTEDPAISTLWLYDDAGTLTVSAGTLSLGEGCTIDADSRGYTTNEGPGAPTEGACGAGHGGRGGWGVSGIPGEPYGSATMPTTLGSGGDGGAGGGAIRLDVSGTLTVDGNITTNAASHTAGAGGSVYITTATFAGTGMIQANGGSTPCPSCTSFHAGGAGGRVAVYYTTNSFTGTVEARPGGGNQGGATTEFQSGTVGLFDISNPAQPHLYTGHSWWFQANDLTKNTSLHNITSVDSAIVVEAEANPVIITGTWDLSRSDTESATTVELYETTGTIHIQAGAMNLGEGCTIDGNENGYSANEGPGVGDPLAGSSHGGLGGTGAHAASPGPTYGSRLEPTALGSGGGGTSGDKGGGAVRLDIEDTLTLDGDILVNGVSGGAGGSSGGSVYITAGGVDGAGYICAKGARGGCPSCSRTAGGGGGGRIAIHFGELAFTGTAEAPGGLSNTGGTSGEDGSVVWMREIPIEIGETSELEHESFVEYVYRLDWAGPDTDIVLVRLTPLDAEGEWTLLGKYKLPPSAGDTDWIGQGPSQDAIQTYEMLVPLSTPGAYYFTVLNEVFTKAAPRFRVEVVDVNRYVPNLTVGTGSNSGATTVDIMAAGLDDGVVVELRTSGGAVLGSYNPLIVGQLGLTVQFDLAGLAPQVADVVLVWGDGHEETITGGFEITGADPGVFELSAEAPSAVRALRTYTLWIIVKNVGGSDLPAPIIRVESEEELMMRTSSESPYRQGPLYLLATRSTLPVTTLPPSTEVRIPIEFMPEGSAHDNLHYRVAIVEETDTSFDWGDPSKAEAPTGINADAWDIIWDQLTADLGATWADFADRMRDDADYLADMGNPQRELARFLDLEFQNAAASTLTHSSQLAIVDAYTTVPKIPIVFERQFKNTIDTRSEAGAFGLGWTHSYEYALSFPETGVAEVSVPGGMVRRFRLSPRGDWQSDRHDFGSFEEIAGGYRLTDRGRVVQTFDASGALVSIMDGDGIGVTLSYNAGNLSTITHTNGDVFSLTYNGSGYISALQDHAGRTTAYTYAGDQLTSVDPPEAAATTYAYDTTAGAARNALQAVHYPDGTERAFTYDTAGHLASHSRDGGAEALAYAYPQVGVVRVTNADGAETSFALDGDDLLLQAIRPLGETTEYHNTSTGLLSQLVAPDGTVKGIDYDDSGNPMALYDALGNEALTQFMPQKRLLEHLRDANDAVSTYEYDDTGNLVSKTYPDGSTCAFTRDDSGLIEQITNRRGGVVNLTRDTRGAITQREIVGERTVDIAYDATGRPTQFTQDATSIAATYDEQDRLTQIQYPSGHTITYEYDDMGKRSRITTDDGLDVNYVYDAVGRLSQLRDGTNALLVEYTYDTVGRVATETRGNGTYTTYAYDLSGRVTDIVHCAPDAQVLDQLAYEYDEMGRCVAVGDLTGETDYNYDAAGRLVSVTYPDASVDTYTYDALGNRTYAVIDGAAQTYTVNSLNQYTNVNGVAHVYDDDGNLVDDGAATYAYDAQNRLTEVAAASGTWAYAYDALDNRASVTKGTETTAFLNDPAMLVNVVGEYNTSGELVAHHVFGLGLVARVDTGGGTYYYGFDRPGNTRLITNGAGAAVNTYQYTPFGVVRQATEGIANPFGFRGAEGTVTDENGLLFMRTRYYAPALGRFLSPDTIDIQGGLNLYAYVGNDPINFTDPAGTQEAWVPVTYIDTGTNWDKLFPTDSPPPPSPQPNNPPDNNPPNNNPAPENTPTPNTNGGKPIEVFPSVYEILNEDVRNLFDLKIIPEVVAPGDPNEKATSGYGTDHIIQADEVIHYTVYFENVPTASAPAQEVVITDQLDTNLDVSTLELTEIVWGDESVPIAAGSSSLNTRQTISDYRADVDKLWWVDIEVGVDGAGELSWTFQTLEPSTNNLPSDVLAGFLPPNDGTGRGEGHVSFTITPKAGLAPGTVITNEATIVFDVEASIDTNRVTNTIAAPCDLEAPAGVQASDGSFSDKVQVTWTEVGDAAEYQVYRSDTGTAGSATSISDWITGTQYDDTTAESPTATSGGGCSGGGQAAHYYYYWVVARDATGCESDMSSSDMGHRGAGKIAAAAAVGLPFLTGGSLGDSLLAALVMLALAVAEGRRRANHRKGAA